jgi:dCTP deaminase
MTMARQQMWEAVHGVVPTITAPKGNPVTSDQLQPASIDLRLGTKVWGIPTSRVPGPHQRVADLLARSEYTFELDVNKTNVLKREHLYVIELVEGCALPPDTWMEFSPKSTTGRCGIHVRVLCDKKPGYDHTPKGYHGPLYLEVDPFAFDVRVKRGLTLVQGRVKNADTQVLVEKELRDMHTQSGLLFRDGNALPHPDVHIEKDRLYYHVDLDRPIVGFIARPGVAMPLNLAASEKDGNLHEPANFWIPILRKQLVDEQLPLMPGSFYLLSSFEDANIPAEACAQMTDMEAMTGEFRTHYAGFFDPGFRNSAVFEVQMFGRPMELGHRSPICSMKFERMLARPDRLYGTNSGSHYAADKHPVGPSLAKIFRSPKEAWHLPYWKEFFS